MTAWIAKSDREYVHLREQYIALRRLGGFTEFWVPFDDKLEAQIISAFGKTGGRLREVVDIRYKKRCFKIYRFNHYYVFVERAGDLDLCELRMSRDVDRWMRLGLAREIYLSRRSTKNVMSVCDGREWAHSVSEMWWEYVTSKGDGSFTKWSKSHRIMVRLRRYKKKHVAGWVR